MMELIDCTTKTEMLDFLDDYASNRRVEMDDEKLKHKRGLIKTYWFESQPNLTEEEKIEEVLAKSDWQYERIRNEALYKIVTVHEVKNKIKLGLNWARVAQTI